MKVSSIRLLLLGLVAAAFLSVGVGCQKTHTVTLGETPVQFRNNRYRQNHFKAVPEFNPVWSAAAYATGDWVRQDF